MFLFACCHVAWTHDALGAVVPAARADANAARHRPGKTAVLRVDEMAADLRWAKDRPHSEVRCNRKRIDRLAGIHHSRRIPDRLELPKRLDELGAVHLFEQHCARLPVTVLARERPTVLDNERCRIVQEGAPGANPCFSGKIEVDASMDEAVAEVTVHRG